MTQSSNFHPMNQPYINRAYNSQTRNSNTINNGGLMNNIMIPSYQSQRLLQYSQASSTSQANFNKQMYSRSSTNIKTDDFSRQAQIAMAHRVQQRGGNYYSGGGYRYGNKQIQNKRNNSQGGEEWRQLPESNGGAKDQQEQSRHYQYQYPQQQQQPQPQEQQLTTQILHEKIHFLQKQLQQLTRLLHQESKHSFGASQGQDYEEVAIQNAQLTIKVQQLEEQLTKINSQNNKLQQQLLQLSKDYEQQHSLNNELRQKLIQTHNENQALRQKGYPQKGNQGKGSEEFKRQGKQERIPSNSMVQTEQNKGNLALLERQNSKLNEEIEELLSKLHNLNLQINQEQSSKEELMSRMNEQLEELQKLRKELSDSEVQKLQLQQMNHYLKLQINQVSQLSVKNQKQLQEKYIKLDIQNDHAKQSYQQQNQTLSLHCNQLQAELTTLKAQLQELKNKIPSPHRESKSEPFKQLFGGFDSSLTQQIRLLEQQLKEQKQRHSLIKVQYTQMLHNRQYRVDQLQSQNRKLSIQNRTLKIQIQDKKKEVQEINEEFRQLKGQYDQMAYKIEEIKTSKTINTGNNIFETHSNTSKRIQSQRDTYEEIMAISNEQERRLQQQLNQQRNSYQLSISRLQEELSQTRNRLKHTSRSLEVKEKQLAQKDLLLDQLHQLQQRHQQLLEQVKLVRKSKLSLQEQLRSHEQTRTDQIQKQTNNLLQLISQKDQQINRLQQRVKQTIQEYSKQNHSLNQDIKKLNCQVQLSQKARNQKVPTLGSQAGPCPLCPEVLKQFNVYKQLMELKFQTMNQMLDQLKISFVRAQFQMKDQIHKDRTKYEHLIEKYDSHDREYRTLMERLWEWQKINARNQQLRKDSSLVHSGKENRSNANEVKVNLISSKQTVKEPAGHLSQIQYDLYLIKLQNSTLRSQICSLEKQLSQRSQKSPQVEKQVLQLKKYSDNLLSENQQLKRHLKQGMFQKRIQSPKQRTAAELELSSRNSKKESIFQKYSNIANINTQLLERTRNEEKALASAQLLISKLKKQNDNLLEAKRQLQQELDQLELNYRQLLKDLQNQRERTRRQHQSKHSHHPPTAKLQLVDRHNIPFQYIKHHPQHKKLQTQYISLKRCYLEMELQSKKTNSLLQEQIQQITIENHFHTDRIKQLQKIYQKSSQTQHNNPNLFSFNQKFSSQIQNIKQNAISLSLSQQTLSNTSTKIKTLQERVLYLQNQVQIKCQECQTYAIKYEQLIKQLSYHPTTPRNNQHINRIQKLAQKIQVSPIQSPQWQNNSAQQQPHSERLFLQNPNTDSISFDCKLVSKLKRCIDKKMIELEITPRESSNLLIKATWFIERLSNDIKELRNNLEILKGQRKAIMKERNELKQRLQNNIQNYSLNQQTRQSFPKSKPNYHQVNNGLNKMKILKGYQSVPKLNFQSNQRGDNIEGDENQFADVIRESLQLKDQRRNGLKKFQKRLQVLTGN